MANLGTTFDATNVEPAKPYEVLPPGKYPAQIVASEMRVTKDGMGQLCVPKIRFCNIGGEARRERAVK